MCSMTYEETCICNLLQLAYDQNYIYNTNKGVASVYFGRFFYRQNRIEPMSKTILGFNPTSSVWVLA